MLAGFYIVVLQEADGGSICSEHLNLARYLAEIAGFPYWYQQLNRKLGKFAQHSNWVLSRLQSGVIEYHKLSGFVPRQSSIFLRYGIGAASFFVALCAK